MADILIIDDDVNIHHIVSLFLESDGHHVSCVTNGESGLDYATHNNLDLIILDLAMPGMDGLETFHALMANPKSKTVPVMILSVHDEGDLPEPIRKDSFVDYLNKPVNMEQLQSSVRTALSR
jgi:DNA-binding response OmpR family regulator